MIQEIIKNLKSHPYHLLILGISAIVMASITQMQSEIGRLALALLVLFVPCILLMGDLIKRKKVNVFSITSEEIVNKEAYEFWDKKFKQAKKSIYFTGDGFPRSDNQSIELAQRTINAMKTALDSGVHIVRLQTCPTTCPEHVEMLIELVNNRKYSNLLELYVFTNPNQRQLADLLCIDETSPDKCIAEVLLPSKQIFGTTSVTIAGTSISVEGHQNFALDIRDRILDLIKSAQRLNNEEQIRAYLRPRKFYFAYGANMDQETMKRRSPSAEFEEIAVLYDYKLVCSVPGKSRAGLVSGVIKAPGEKVYGVIWSIAEHEIKRLDEIEDLTTYLRVDLEVFRENGEGPLMCAVYVASQVVDGACDKRYLELLINAAESRKLPPEYVDMLRKWADG
jgi:gamma-glutamylcyclotransferase (GGCT)/AIG2-like uncharacterized protein YtfP